MYTKNFDNYIYIFSDFLKICFFFNYLNSILRRLESTRVTLYLLRRLVLPVSPCIYSGDQYYPCHPVFTQQTSTTRVTLFLLSRLVLRVSPCINSVDQYLPVSPCIYSGDQYYACQPVFTQETSTTRVTLYFV